MPHSEQESRQGEERTGDVVVLDNLEGSMPLEPRAGKLLEFELEEEIENQDLEAINEEEDTMWGERARPDPNTTNRLATRTDGERLLPPWSLRDSCLWKVRNDILNWSREGSLRKSRSSYAHYQPFANYPIQLRQEILDSMLRLKPDGREVVGAVKLLIQSGIFSFDLNCLNECESYDVFRVINSLVRHGNLLQELNVGGQWLYDPRANYLVCKLLRNAPNLKKLVLQEATEEGRELETILASCFNLRHLEIRHPSVDDKYLEILLRGGREPKSTKLTSVIVPSTVKAEGLLTLLKVFPNLQYMECSHLEETLDALEAKEDDRDWWKERGAGILGVKTTQPMGPKGVSKLVHWFPNLKTVALEVQEYMNLSSLSDLSNLKSLELRNSATLPASYIQCVLPLLNEAGRKLTHLGLEHFDVVDLSKTSLSCPELNSLTLRWFTLLGTSSVKVKGHVPFEKLQSICLRPRTNRHINKEACELLLSNCTGMRHVELYCCHGLDDNTVEKLVKTNPLASLRTLILRHGHGLSSKGIQTLICRSKHLLYWDFGEVNSPKSN